MAISARLSRTLRESLGEEGADDLVNWMMHVEASRSELQDVMEAWRVTTDSRFAELGARIDLRFSEQQQEMRLGFSNLESRFERRFGDLLEWSFVFWCGAVGAVAVLAHALK